MDGEIFESGTKRLRIRKYPDTCGRGLNEILIFGVENQSRHAKNRVSQTFFEIQMQAGYTSNNRCLSGTTILSVMLINLHDEQAEILKLLSLILLLQHLPKCKTKYFFFLKLETIIPYLKFRVSSSQKQNAQLSRKFVFIGNEERK